MQIVMTLVFHTRTFRHVKASRRKWQECEKIRLQLNKISEMQQGIPLTQSKWIRKVIKIHNPHKFEDVNLVTASKLIYFGSL